MMNDKKAREILTELRLSGHFGSFKDLNEALETTVKALEKLDHLTNRPCEACEYHKQTGCSQWSCVFEEVNADADSD